MRFVVRSIVAMTLMVGACRKTEPPPKPPSTSQATEYDEVPYRNGPPGAQTKVFLVAGGEDIANFAAEVVEQRELWKAAGLRDEEIACYYAKPTPKAYQADQMQYATLRPALQHCFAATPKRVLDDLRAASQSKLPYLYLYVTAHGTDSILRLIGRKARRALLPQLTEAQREFLGQPAMALHAGQSPPLTEPRALARAFDQGVPDRELVFSPAALAQALNAFPEQTRKVVVLQGCYSGSFIDPPAQPPDSVMLTQVSNLVMITATAQDRASFGCGSGQSKTYFGGAYNLALRQALAGPPHTPIDLPWAQVFEKTTFAVEAMETINGEEPSNPLFLETGPGPG